MNNAILQANQNSSFTPKIRKVIKITFNMEHDLTLAVKDTSSLSKKDLFFHLSIISQYYVHPCSAVCMAEVCQSDQQRELQASAFSS